MCDDMVVVDRDWSNTRLARHVLPARIVGREADGAPTDRGAGYLRRADLIGDINGGFDGGSSAGAGSADLGVLYRAAAWLSGHPRRGRHRYFPDVGTGTSPTSPAPHRRGVNSTPSPPPSRHADTHPGKPHPRRHRPTTVVGLAAHPWCRSCGGLAAPVDHPPSQRRARHRGTGSDGSAAARPTGRGVVTWTRYLRYCHLLHTWAAHADVRCRAIEMWLICGGAYAPPHTTPTHDGGKRDDERDDDPNRQGTTATCGSPRHP